MYYCLSGFDLQSTLSDEWERLSNFPLHHSPSDSTALAERLLYNFLQQYLSLHPQEDLHQQGQAPCSGLNCLGESTSTWMGQCVGWMESSLKSGMRLLTNLGSKSQERGLPRGKNLWEGFSSPLPSSASGCLVYALQSGGK